MSARRVLLNRYVVVLGTAAVLVGGWNVWVVMHDDGIVRGRVTATFGGTKPTAAPAAGRKGRS